MVCGNRGIWDGKSTTWQNYDTFPFILYPLYNAKEFDGYIIKAIFFYHFGIRVPSNAQDKT